LLLRSIDASTIGLRLDFPLFSGGYYHTSQEKAKLQLQTAKLNEEQVKEKGEKIAAVVKKVLSNSSVTV